jgi:AcrR family transcriptional regulator
MTARPDRPQPGLRERKKAKTRAAIREHALRLFREQGYQATTVEQIAEAAEVSESTFFRYFPTKEDVVLQDDMDTAMARVFEVQPPGLAPIAALRATLRAVFAELPAEELARMRESTTLALAVPEVRARVLDEFTRTIQVLAEAVAGRVGRDPGDFAVRAFAGAVLGVAVAAWFAAPGDMEEVFRLFDAGLAHLEAGLPL